jgi:hypothetical protein
MTGQSRKGFEQYCANQCQSVLAQCKANILVAGYEVKG